MRVLALAALLLVAPLLARAQSARPTTLLKEDVAAGKRTRLDELPDEVGAAIDQVLGPGGFSTRELDRVLDKVREGMRRERPRAPARLIVFLYPGRVEAQQLKALKEVLVDIEIVIDPCDRAVCEASAARHVELVGRALATEQPARGSYRLAFKDLSVTTVTQAPADLQVYRGSLAECVRESAQPGGGQAWIDALRRAVQGYEPLIVKGVARQAGLRRVALTQPPAVSRGPGGVEVLLRVRGDRNRAEQQVLDALVAAEAGMRENPATPVLRTIQVELEVPHRHLVVRRFRCAGAPLSQYLDGKLDQKVLWQSYIDEVNQEKGVLRLDFSKD